MLTFAEPRAKSKGRIESTDKLMSARRVWRNMRYHDDGGWGLPPWRRRLLHTKLERVMESEDSDKPVLFAPIGDKALKGNKRCSVEVARNRIARAVFDLMHAVGEKYERGTKAILVLPAALLPLLDEFVGGAVARGIGELFERFDIEFSVIAVHARRKEPLQEIAWESLGD